LIALVCVTVGKVGYYSVEWGIRKVAPPAVAAIEIHRLPQPVAETKRSKLDR
jgi:hypothetical protein